LKLFSFQGIVTKINFSLYLGIIYISFLLGAFGGKDAIIFWKSLAFAISVYALVLVHEYGHALMAKKLGYQVKEIELFMIGGIARMNVGPLSKGGLLVFSAGPAVSAGLSIILGVIVLATGSAKTLFQINTAILIFNLIPIYPLDGGRILNQLFLKTFSGNIERAKSASLFLSHVLAVALLALGVMSFQIILIIVSVLLLFFSRKIMDAEFRPRT